MTRRSRDPSRYRVPSARLPRFVARIRASIQTKLLIAFLLILSLMVLLGAIGLGNLHRANERATELVRLQRQIAAFQRLQHNATGQMYATASAILAQNNRQIANADRQLKRLGYDFTRARFVSQENTTLLDEIASDYDRFIHVGAEIVDKVKAGDRDGARHLHFSEMVPLSKQLNRKALRLVTATEADMVEHAATSARAYRLSQIAMIATALASMILALILGYSISAALTVPIRGLRQRLRKIAAGDLEQTIEVENRDEIGDLATNFNRMSQSLHELYDSLEKANRHKSAFLANVSHELRTPMNSIIGFNRLVMRRCKDVLPEKQYDNLGKIAVSANQLLILINSILDLSKIEAGKLEVFPSEAPLAPMLETCARTIEPLLSGRDVTLSVDISAETPIVYTDHDRLRQIVLNLLSNAAKFTEAGMIKLSAQSSSTRVVICVADTGIGIPEDRAATIFDEFTQADSGSARRYPGTGLGLAISKRLVTLLDGEISFTTKEGQGSTFRVKIPIRRSGAVSITEPHRAYQFSVNGAAS